MFEFIFFLKNHNQNSKTNEIQSIELVATRQKKLITLIDQLLFN